MQSKPTRNFGLLSVFRFGIRIRDVQLAVSAYRDAAKNSGRQQSTQVGTHSSCQQRRHLAVGARRSCGHHRARSVDGFGNPPGLNGRLELQNWADAGAPLSLILRAATLDNAMALGLSHELGSVEVGKRADLLLLRDDPLATISAYDSIETLFLKGEPIAPETLRAHD